MSGLDPFVFAAFTPGPKNQQPEPAVPIARFDLQTPSLVSERPDENLKRGSYALSIASETIQVTIGSKPLANLADNSSSPKKQSYHLHVSKLRQISDYFDGLFRFNGTEIQQNHIYLSEGFEGLALAFDAFVEFMYTHSYRNGTESVSGLNGPMASSESAELDASVIVLAERLVVTDLKNLAVEAFQRSLTPSLPGLLVMAPPRATESIVKIIMLIYNGTHRPYGDVAGIKLDKKPRKMLPTVPDIFSTANHNTQHPTGFPTWFGSSAKRTNEGILAQKTLPTTTLKLLASNPSSFGYKNCRARKIVAKHCAQNLSRYRGSPDFRELVSEIGEFAVDLLMEEIHVLDSGLVVVL